MACTDRSLKIILVLFNFVMFILGLAMAGVGLTIRFSVNLNAIEAIKPFTEDFNVRGDRTSFMLISAGFIVAVAAFHGCCGTLRSNSRTVLICFVAARILYFVIFVVLMILIYVSFKDLNGKDLEEVIEKKFHNYDNYKGIIDPFQRQQKCCGYNGETEYSTGIPDSCCEKTEGTKSCTSANAFELTCKEKIRELMGDLLKLMNKKGVMEWAVIGIAIIEVPIILFYIYLVGRSKSYVFNLARN